MGKLFVADFETTTEATYLIEKEVRVWGWGLVEIGSEEVMLGNNIDTFMQTILNLDNPLIYFHNLRFDMPFIFSWLLRNGYEWSESKTDNSINGLISGNNQLYQIEIIVKKFNKRYKKLTFQDSLKKLPFPVKRIGHAFKLDVLKGDIDYDLYRPIGWQLTEEEKAYIRNDVLIVSKALMIQAKNGLVKMTIGSDALSTFKDMIGKRMFETLFPILHLELDAKIRLAYKGGYTYVNPKYQGLEMGEGCVFDVNSLYPYVMYDKPMPIKRPKKFRGKYEYDSLYPLYIQMIRVDFKIKTDHIPTIQLKTSFRFGDTEYATESNGEVTLVLTSVDLQLFFDHYDVLSIEYLGGYKFQSNKGIFQGYIDHFMEIKANETGALREIAKLMLNSLYGKFATNPNITGKRVALGEYGEVRYELKDEEFRDPVFTALGCFITAYAREKTIRTAQENYDRFIYCDTDSLHLIGLEPPNIEVHPSKLGAWKHEYDFIKGKFVRPKMYYEIHPDGSKTVKGAGIPESERSDIIFEDYGIGLQYKKLMPKQVKGGTLLTQIIAEVKS